MKTITSSLSPLAILILLVAIFFIHLNPFSLWMSDMASMVVTGLFCTVIVIYTALFWKEAPRDEREALHAGIADRYAFMSANVILILGVLIQMFGHTSYTWLLGTLFVMNTIKIVSRHLLERDH